MAILNSITIGKGRKSLGNVTLQTLGGVVVAKQKIMRNKSNTMKQAKQRGEFKRIMNVLRKFAPLARAAYSRVKTQSAFSRFAKMLYEPASGVTPASLASKTPFELIQAIVNAGGDAPMVEGAKVFSSVDVHAEYSDFVLSAQFPGQVPRTVGENVPVDIQICASASGQISTTTLSLPLTDAQIVDDTTSALSIFGGVLTLRLANLLTGADYPIISINNERIGMRAADYIN